MPSKTKKQGARSNRLPVAVSGQISLLTDFGTADYFVGAVKAVILSINPTATIVDITHEIPAQDIEAAAFTLLASYRSFAPGTVHLAVVDPGVGSKRRPIVAQAGGQLFVGPDNGIFSYVFDKEPDYKVFHVTSSKHLRLPLSNTFHGRDVFAPLAAALASGLKAESLGSEISDSVRLPALQPELRKDGRMKARIIHVDHFGNCVTNIDRGVLSKDQEGRATLVFRGERIKTFRESYAEDKSKDLFAIWGSAGFLEISARNRSAAKVLKAKRGDVISLRIAGEGK